MENSISQLSLFGGKESTPTLQVAGCCPNCGSRERKLGAGKPPHIAVLQCGNCDQWIKWLSKSEFEKLGGAK